MRLIEERRGRAVISYVYEPGSYVPLARLDAGGERTEQGGLGTTQDAQQPGISKTIAASASQTSATGQKPPHTPAASDTPLCEVYYFHTDPSGLPEELSNAQGQIIWQAQYKTWGATVQESWEARRLHAGKEQGRAQGDIPQGARQEQNLRFQGQYLDRETGLHYNTFRYYDADIGRFISPDPIGLGGGINLGSYGPNPISWIDPWGWACIQQKIDGTRREERVGAKLKAIFGKDNVLRERALRNAKGERVKDNSPGGDGTGRNIDYVVKGKDGKWRPLEVTSKTADKTAQLTKERAIRNQGGTHVRIPGSKVLVPVEGTSRVIRVD